MARVLVIDDEAPIRLLCRVNLEAAKIEVSEAEDGRSGLEAALAERPDLILLDVMMPGMDGWQVFEQLLQDERTEKIPIVFLTARAELRDQARGLELGGIDYVTKPFNPLNLAPLIEDLLARVERGEEQELRRERLAELRQFLSATSPAKSAVTRRVLPPARPTPTRRKSRSSKFCLCGGLATHIWTIAAAESGFVPDARFSPTYGARTPNRRRRWTKGPWSK